MIKFICGDYDDVYFEFLGKKYTRFSSYWKKGYKIALVHDRVYHRYTNSTEGESITYLHKSEGEYII